MIWKKSESLQSLLTLIVKVMVVSNIMTRQLRGRQKFSIDRYKLIDQKRNNSGFTYTVIDSEVL